jgi:phosphate transport system substrate-binding protein
MKTKSISVAVAMFLSMATFAQTKITIKGSDTCLPLVQKEAEDFMKADKSRSVTVIGGGSGVGIAALMDGTTDVAMSSRALKMDEKLKLQEAGKNVKTTIMAYDALSVVVNPANKVDQLTREQLDGIFTGKIKNWKEVGGDDMQIIVYSRESSSGTFEFFKEKVLLNKNYASNALMMPATGAIIQSVAQTKGAIGYVGLAYVEKTVKDVKVSFDKGKTFTAASYDNAKNKSYPIVRPLFLFYTGKVESMIKPFVDYVLSATGQGIVKEVGYIDLGK